MIRAIWLELLGLREYRVVCTYTNRGVYTVRVENMCMTSGLRP